MLRGSPQSLTLPCNSPTAGRARDLLGRGLRRERLMSDSSSTSTTDRIRALNDALRQGDTSLGKIVLTSGVQALVNEFVETALKAVAAFSDFSPDNDPYGEHDFGAVEVDGEKLFFKIDYYDPTLTMHASDPSDPKVTHRVLTIMLASEY